MILPRSVGDRDGVRVKTTTRPGGGTTDKAEMDDLAERADTRPERERLRRGVENDVG